MVGGVSGSLAAYVGVRLMNMRWRHRPQAEWVDGETMVLRQPPIRQWAGAFALAFLVVLLPVAKVTRGPSNPTTLPMVLLLLGLAVLVGIMGWVIGRRRISVDSEAIELSGANGRRITWSQVAEVHAIRVPQGKMLVFSRGHGKAIAVDSSYYGWEEFLEKLSEIAPEAGSKVARAIKRLERGT